MFQLSVQTKIVGEDITEKEQEKFINNQFTDEDIAKEAEAKVVSEVGQTNSATDSNL
jgi:hypothetical protein